MRIMRTLRMLKNNENFLVSYIIIMLIFCLLPVFIKRAFSVNVLILSLIWAIMGLGWNVIGGYGGQVSNGHAVFYAFGAYTSALCMNWFEMSPWISMWIGAAISTGFAVIIGMPLLRLKGHYFAIATMALAECTRIIFTNWDFVGGATGISCNNRNLPEWYSLQFQEKYPMYYICLGFMALTILAVKIVGSSRFGYGLRAIKENEDAAMSSGVNAPGSKLAAYIISAVIVSIAGSLYAQYVQYIDPVSLLPIANSMLIVLVCVMGGIGTVWGPVLGALLMTHINEYSRAVFARFSGLNLVIYGILVIIIVLFLPEGLISIPDRLRKRKAAKRG